MAPICPRAPELVWVHGLTAGDVMVNGSIPCGVTAAARSSMGRPRQAGAVIIAGAGRKRVSHRRAGCGACLQLMIETTRNLVEAAGAAPLAAALNLRDQLIGKCVALILSGGNASREQLLDVLTREHAMSLGTRHESDSANS
jgi:hypothetical protein